MRNTIFEQLDNIYEEEQYNQLKEALQKKSVEDIVNDGFSQELAEDIHDCEHNKNVVHTTWDELTNLIHNALLGD